MSTALFRQTNSWSRLSIRRDISQTIDLIDVYLYHGTMRPTHYRRSINEPVPGFEVFDPPLTMDDFNKIAGLLVELNGFYKMDL